MKSKKSRGERIAEAKKILESSISGDPNWERRAASNGVSIDLKKFKKLLSLLKPERISEESQASCFSPCCSGENYP